jgi:ferredoxin
MANENAKWPDNKAGKYFVDDQCIDCDACRTEAPANFTRNDEHGYSYVIKQPESPEEEEKCKAALEACPVEAIGNNNK